MKKFCFIIAIVIATFPSIGQTSDSLMNLVYFHYDRNEFAEVVCIADEAVAIFEAEGDLFDLAGCHNIMGVAYQRMGKFEEAIDSYNRCCEVMEELKQSDPDNAFYDRNIRYTKNNIAGIYSSMGEYGRSLDLYRSCMESLGELRDTLDFLDRATYLQNIADVIISQQQELDTLQDVHQLEGAVAMAEEAYELSQRYGDYPFKLLYRMLTLSKAYYAVGRTDKAAELAKEGLSLTGNVDDSYPRTEFLMLLGSFNYEQGHYKEAEADFTEALALARQGQYGEAEYKALQGAYRSAKESNSERALAYLEESVQLKDSIFNERQQELIRDYQVRYDLSEKEHQIEIQQQRTRQSLWLFIATLVIAVILAVLLVIWIRLNHANRRQKDILQNLNEVKDKLLSVNSHDVKTSVVAQNMVLDQLYQHCDSMSESELKKYLLTLKTSSDALKDKLSNILQWVMGELGNRESHPTQFNLSQAVNSCLTSLSAEMEVKQITAHVDVNPDLMCYDDKNIIGLVLQNLLSNAVKFSHSGGAVSLKAEDEGEKIWVAVTDQGMGIAPERLQTLLKDCVQPQQGTSGEMGTGLGLLVCRQLLERNQGSIQIESTEAKGTTVRFSINKQKTHEPS